MKRSLTQGVTLCDGIYVRFLLWSRAGLGAIGLVVALATSMLAQTLAQRSPEGTASNLSTPPVLIQRSPLRTGSQGAEVSELQALLQLLGYYSGPVNGIYGDSTAIAVANFQAAAGLAADGVVGPATWERLVPVEPSPPSTTQTNLLTTTTATTDLGAVPSNTSAAAFPAPSLVQSDRSNLASTAPSGSTNPSTATSLPPTNDPNSNPTSTVELPVLRLGMQGSAVTRLQERLQAVGLFSGVIDGVFGPATETSVKAAQNRYQLEPDGVVGPATWQALLSN